MEGMMLFYQLLPEIGFSQTRTITLLKARGGLPAGNYGFLELYCVDPRCDCRRVMFNVLSEKKNAHLATINHAFEPPLPHDLVHEQTFLDELNRQSKYSGALLDLFKEVLLKDAAFCKRLERHYRMVKEALQNPVHPIWKVVHSVDDEKAETNLRKACAKLDPYMPCLCGSGKKFKWCCRERMIDEKNHSSF